MVLSYQSSADGKILELKSTRDGSIIAFALLALASQNFFVGCRSLENLCSAIKVFGQHASFRGFQRDLH